jgi:hypothetical protein
MTAHRSIRRRSYWIDIDEAASLLGARPEEVLCLVREGILFARGRGRRELVLQAAEVKALAACFAQISSISRRLTDAGPKRKRKTGPRASRSTVRGTKVAG